jgi:electron transport complex protein RnfC
MGGAGFPTHVKLNPRPTQKIDTIIANAAECEPYLTIDEATLTEKTKDVVMGIVIVCHIMGVKKGLIGMEDNTASLVPTIEKAIKENEHAKDMDISVALCKTKYPQGGEKMLIESLTGRQVPSAKLPADVGCVVDNVGTLAAISDAFLLGKPLIDRGFTFSGKAAKTPKNIVAPMGTLLTDLPKDFIDYDMDKCVRILFGGPMMGQSVPTLEIPIQKNTSGILLMTKDETAAFAEGYCIRCTRCLRNCPMWLSPVIMNDALKAGDLDEATDAGLMDCIECGACTFICPAHIKLVQHFRVGKALRKAQLAARKAEADAKAAAAKAKAEKAAQPAEAKA